MVDGSCRIGCNQSESHRLTAGKPLAPVVKSLIAEAAIPAKDTDRKPALLLLPDQFCPLLLTRRTCLDSSHPSHYRTRPSSCARGVHVALTQLVCRFVSEQAVNARLRIGLYSVYWSAFASYAGGTFAMAISSCSARRPAFYGASPKRTVVDLDGGGLGAIYVVTAILLLPRIGAAATVGFIVLERCLCRCFLIELARPIFPFTP